MEMNIAILNAVQQTFKGLVQLSAKKATKYISDKLVVNMTRKTFKNKIQKGNIDVIVKCGVPNYREREFIKKCKEAGESFPVKKIQFKFPPKKK